MGARVGWGRGAALALLLGACDLQGVGGARAAITSSTADTGDDAVVGLVAGGQIYCTAVVVAPRVLLTAGHCLAGPAPESAFFGASLADGGTQVAVIDVAVHPQFDGATLDHDLGMALLAAPAGAPAVPLPVGPLGAGDVGSALRIVGFGATENAADGLGVKREGTARLARVDGDTIELAADPSQPCDGDSGGPAFLGGGSGETLVGITSSGDPSCTGGATDTRVDVHVDDFVAPYVAATAEGARAVGERCWYDGNCDSGACVQPDPEGFAYCSESCSGDGDCASGMRCDGDGSCQWASPVPGAPGAACGSDADCAGIHCASAGERDSTCAPRCFSDGALPCPDGFDCLPTAAGGGEEACFVAEPGGCCGAGGGAGCAPLVLLVGGLLAHRRRLRSYFGHGR